MSNYLKQTVTISMQRKAIRFCIYICLTLLQLDGVAAETFTGNASVVIQQQLQVSEAEPIAFGRIFTQNNAAGSVILTPEGNLLTDNVDSASDLPIQSGGFNLNGSPNALVSISFEDGLLTGTGAPLRLSSFTHNAGNTPRFDDDGNLNFRVGATLEINDGQIGGAYDGSYTITIDYQ